MMRRAFTGVFYLAALISSPGLADVAGRASVIDGDTLEVAGERVRLWGVDAPEGEQLCADAAGRRYRCGQRAALALATWIGGRNLECRQVDRDRYERAVSRCTVAGRDVGAWLVGKGWATDYAEYSGGAYAAQEARARAAKAGIWAGAFTEPLAWRRQGRAGAASSSGSAGGTQTAARQGCSVKGNINRKGERIYHSPGMRSYSETQINTGRGERWFCSEAEARAAGWRAPRG